MIDLEQLINDAYNRHLQAKELENQQRLAQEEAQRQFAIAEFREKFDPIFSADLQKAMGIEFDGDHHRTFARFVYQGTQFYIHRYGAEVWKVETDYGDTFTAPSLKVVNRLFVAMGEIKALFLRRKISLEDAESKLTFSLCEAEQVYDHSGDFLSTAEIEAFGEKLKTAIGILNDLSIALAAKLESEDRPI
ncbi:hypothetical protein [Nostoc sp. DedQUE07]|uniref:hypothetical protein n=1 Tax=Nostoc sp. DedQUE07 TaxID=3075392 RepID=UPI002AD560A6|nr:hypothetical protein [Nostoc sp. DedQUE07]MDZ8131874.1 hypothetical protein [Nostoc sp. DedQUE07]